jgi:hypothetical protein
MDATPGQRKAAFVVIVLALAGLGIFLVRPGASGSATSPRSPAAAPATTTPATPVATATQTPAATPAPAVAPAPDPASSGNAGIYQWLPFTPSELTRAASVATRFGDLYGTFSYSENATGYAQKMRNVITAQLSGVLARAYATAGVAGPRLREKQVSTGTSSISSLRAFGSGSITFIVTIRQKITDTRGVSRSTGQYAVTVAGSGGSWQVSDIELASAGNS